MTRARFIVQCDEGTFPAVELLDDSATMRIEHSSWATVDMGNGLVMESFILFLNDTPITMQANIRLLASHLNLAHELYINPNPHERVRVLERMTDENAVRSATTIGGTITPLSGGVVTREQKRSAARFAVTIERYALWEYDTPQYIKRSTLSCHGGSVDLPLKFASGVQDGRIRTLAITANGNARIKQFWIGIKPARSILDGFDPAVELETEGIIKLTPGFSGWATDDTTFFGDKALLVNFTNYTDWTQAVRIYLKNFNASTTAANRIQYHGKYHLILRYKTASDMGETYGIRAGYGWGKNPDATKLEPHYLSPTNDALRYIDLGVIDIGGAGFSYETLRRAALRDFAISIHAAIWDQDASGYPGEWSNAAFLYLDTMWLVPADNFIHVVLDTPIGGGAQDSNFRAEIYMDEAGGVYGLQIWETDKDGLGGVLASKLQVRESITDIAADNWSMPTAENSVLIFVADTTEGSTLGKSATVIMQLESMSRTVIV